MIHVYRMIIIYIDTQKTDGHGWMRNNVKYIDWEMDP